jgi:hypothetical protein
MLRFAAFMFAVFADFWDLVLPSCPHEVKACVAGGLLKWWKLAGLDRVDEQQPPAIAGED